MNDAQAPLYELLYTSSLTPAVSVLDVAIVVGAARRRNAERGITGTLVFDGLRFCHYLEGPQPAVRELAQRIAADSRHVGFAVRHEGPMSGERRFAGSSLGYALAQDAGALDVLDFARGEEAIASLLQVLPCCEREP